MTKEKLKTLDDYLYEKRCSVKKFCEETKVTADVVYKHKDSREMPITRATMVKISRGTQKMFGEPLMPQDYLDLI